MRYEEITPEMTAKVQELIATEFKDATPEDIELYAEWKSAIETHTEEFRIKEETLREHAERSIAIAEENGTIAKETLIAKRDYAKARLEELRKKVN